MKNTLRCCISCILPCGALDVIRVVHTNGKVEEISGPITAAEIMKEYPKHVLKKPSTYSEEGMCPKIVVVPPDAELQRGKIYFLMPLPSLPDKNNRSKSSSSAKKSTNSKKNKEASESTTTRRRRRNAGGNNINSIGVRNIVTSDRYLSEIMSEKLSTQKDRRRNRAAVWRPHLDSISETTSDP